MAGILVGQKATGKSTELERIARDYSKSGKKALILDVNGSPAYAKVPAIQTADEFRKWCTGKSDIGPLAKYYDPDHVVMFEFLIKYFRNGLVVFEDCTKYIDATPSREIKTFLVDHRMWNVDLLFTFHAVSMVPPFFWKMTSYVILKRTTEVFRPSDKFRYPFWEALQKGIERLKKSKNPYESVVIETGL